MSTSDRSKWSGLIISIIMTFMFYSTYVDTVKLLFTFFFFYYYQTWFSIARSAWTLDLAEHVLACNICSSSVDTGYLVYLHNHFLQSIIMSKYQFSGDCWESYNILLLSTAKGNETLIAILVQLRKVEWITKYGQKI